MKSTKIIAFFGICIACGITGSNALLFRRLVMLPRVEEIFKTIGIPATRSPSFPEKKKTTTTTTTTTTATTTLHPDDVTIALCNEAMSECPWTSDELVAKIIERQNVDTNVEFTGKGESVGPTVNPSKVANKLKPEIPETKPSKVGKGTSAKGTRRGVGKGSSSRVPKICLPFGQKRLHPVSYYINCINYLSDTTIPHYNNRRNAMLGCFKCRYLCELGGAVEYF